MLSYKLRAYYHDEEIITPLNHAAMTYGQPINTIIIPNVPTAFWTGTLTSLSIVWRCTTAKSKKVKPRQKVREKITGVDLRVQSHQKCHKVMFVFDVSASTDLELSLHPATVPHTPAMSQANDDIQVQNTSNIGILKTKAINTKAQIPNIPGPANLSKRSLYGPGWNALLNAGIIVLFVGTLLIGAAAPRRVAVGGI